MGTASATLPTTHIWRVLACYQKDVNDFKSSDASAIKPRG